MAEFLKLRTAEEAWDVFRAQFAPAIHDEACRVVDALDRVLAAAALAPHDLPTFVSSTVDGYAVLASTTHGASNGLPAYLDVMAEVPMGARARDLYQAFADAGQGGLDFSCIIRMLARKEEGTAG